MGEMKCPECGRNMVIRKGQKGYFLGCSKYPSCKGEMSIEVELVQSYLDYKREVGKGLNCPRCNSPMKARKGKYGVFLSCSWYPHCKCTQKIDVIL